MTINYSKNSIKKVYKESYLGVKSEIAKKILSGKYTQRELVTTFNVSKSVVARISKNAEMFLDIENIDNDKKRLTKANRNKEFNELIMDRIRKLRSNTMCITKTMIIDTGKYIQLKILS